MRVKSNILFHFHSYLRASTCGFKMRHKSILECSPSEPERIERTVPALPRYASRPWRDPLGNRLAVST